jgi:hypothetical protein
MKKIFWVCLLSLLMQSFFLVPVQASDYDIIDEDL